MCVVFGWFGRIWFVLVFSFVVFKRFAGNLSLFKPKAPTQSMSASEPKSSIPGIQSCLNVTDTDRQENRKGDFSAHLLLIQKC